MIKQGVSKVKLQNFIDDATYLVDEAEALKYVIDSVPFAVTPAGGMSIFNKLRLIDHAQNTYYKPIIQSVFSENRTIKLQSTTHYTETFELESDEEANVAKVLQRIIKYRAALLNIIEKMPEASWERTLLDSRGETIPLIEFAERMIMDERKLLKEIADLVLVYQKEREQQREIDKKTVQRQELSNP